MVNQNLHSKMCLHFSYLIPPEAYPGRVSLLLTTLLTLASLSLGLMATTPNSGNANLVDIWFQFCLGFVFVSLMVYAMILFQIEFPKFKCKSANQKRHSLDNYALFLSPILFFLFMVIYYVICIVQNVIKFQVHLQLIGFWKC